MNILYYAEIVSPVGDILVFSDGHAICHLDFSDCRDRADRLLQRHFAHYSLQQKDNPLQIRTRLTAYFAGKSDAFDGVKLNPGGTPFQQKVWAQLQKIPFGRTLSYAELAIAIGQESAVRAVAGANAKNPVAIIIPCHRVIASNGSLAGYAGGVERKAWFLSHEGSLPAKTMQVDMFQANPASGN